MRSSPLADVRAEGERVAAAAAAAGVTVRLCGGVAVALLCPSARQPPLARTYKDVDLVALRRERADVAALLADLGYAPRDEFNVLQGGRRLLFWDEVNERQLDVMLDRFEMCHALELTDRLHAHDVTLEPSDLLLTKLQVRETNDRDTKDMLALVLDTDPDVRRVAAVLSDDWGWWRTGTEVLARVRAGARVLAAEDEARAHTWLDRLDREIEAAPKSTRWKLRARIGERVRWYEEPEDDY